MRWPSSWTVSGSGPICALIKGGGDGEAEGGGGEGEVGVGGGDEGGGRDGGIVGGGRDGIGGASGKGESGEGGGEYGGGANGGGYAGGNGSAMRHSGSGRQQGSHQPTTRTERHSQTVAKVPKPAVGGFLFPRSLTASSRPIRALVCCAFCGASCASLL